ncbi:MurR/RpiR family transcriptional regulator [Actinophytocola gossypii]|uniref:MurR/RpiR family transcriptional regulator n=1 Tax=Actinophytocola gossypii TaxID=2812003 RepID=A0ABT2J1W2_9PSEU|nr:MurR/RpiR family transcriptional regulator [Actinophytocola gossypii]MCT2581837.1 MurR/RpiR family transcriptional regulator [Actinophytocola gossypii]
MSLRDVARQLDGVLSESSRRALNLLLADPHEMAKLSAAKVAERLGVHETTVIRLARQLGYSGYRQLRDDLNRSAEDDARRDLAALTSADRARSRGETAYTLASLVSDEVAALQRLVRLVPQEQVDALASAIIAAGRTYLFGPPYARSTMEILERRLRRLGVAVVSLPMSGRLLAEHLTALGQNDLVLSFVYRLPSPRLDRINGYAASVRATTAVIADEDGLSYQPRPDHLIVAPRGPRDSQRSQVVPIVLSYALQAALHHLAADRVEDTLLLLDDIAKVVGDDEPSHGA